MQALIEGGQRIWDAAREAIASTPDEAVVPLAGTRLLSPLPRPIRIRDCCMMIEHMVNGYAKHPELGKTVHPEFYRQVIYYNADHLHVFGHDDDIRWPRHSKDIDYELEWACVIGRTVENVREEDALSEIFGFTIFNDWSARDVQIPFMMGDLGPGEGKDFANSLGPCIVTLDEFEDPYALRMTARVNGEQWSSGLTGSMTHKFEKAIAQFSRDRPLYAGEVIGSGTVLEGCGAELGKYLNLGDVVELEVEGIGVLRNRVVSWEPQQSV